MNSGLNYFYFIFLKKKIGGQFALLIKGCLKHHLNYFDHDISIKVD